MAAGDPCPPRVRRYGEDKRQQNQRVFPSSHSEEKRTERQEDEETERTEKETKQTTCEVERCFFILTAPFSLVEETKNRNIGGTRRSKPNG